jgi:hypothetical protein
VLKLLVRACSDQQIGATNTTYTIDDRFQAAVKLLFVSMGDGSNLVIIPVGKNAANKNLIRSDFAFGRLVDTHDILLNLLWNDWG